jgi:hypothetical protein
MVNLLGTIIIILDIPYYYLHYIVMYVSMTCDPIIPKVVGLIPRATHPFGVGGAATNTTESIVFSL